MKVVARLSGAFVGVAMGLVAAQASAGVATINFVGNGGVQSGNSMLFSNGDLSVSVIAGATALNGEYNISSRIAQYSDGLGNLSNYSYTKQFCFFNCVQNVTDSNTEVDDDVNFLNGHGVREYLKLDFGGLDVQLTSVDFGAHDIFDDASVTINNNSTTLYSGNADPVTNLASHAATNQFWILAGLDGFYNNDWKLKSITFSYQDANPGPNPQEDVPAPAALSILGLGLAGLGILRRRRG